MRYAKTFMLVLLLLAWSAEEQVRHISVADFLDVLKYGTANDTADVFRAGNFSVNLSYQGFPVLMLAVAESADTGVIRCLIDIGADVNAVYSGDFSVLMMAAKYGNNPKVIDLLIDAGADLNAELEDRTTALMLAEHFNPNPEIASHIREHKPAKSLPREIRRGLKVLYAVALRLAFQFL